MAVMLMAIGMAIPSISSGQVFLRHLERDTDPVSVIVSDSAGVAYWSEGGILDTMYQKPDSVCFRFAGDAEDVCYPFAAGEQELGISRSGDSVYISIIPGNTVAFRDSTRSDADIAGVARDSVVMPDTAVWTWIDSARQLVRCQGEGIDSTIVCELGFDGVDDYGQAQNMSDLSFALPIEIIFTAYGSGTIDLVTKAIDAGDNNRYWISYISGDLGLSITSSTGVSENLRFTYPLDIDSTYIYRVYNDGLGNFVQEVNGVIERTDPINFLPQPNSDYPFRLARYNFVNNPGSDRFSEMDMHYLRIGSEEFTFEECEGNSIVGTQGTVIDLFGATWGSQDTVITSSITCDTFNITDTYIDSIFHSADSIHFQRNDGKIWTLIDNDTQADLSGLRDTASWLIDTTEVIRGDLDSHIDLDLDLDPTNELQDLSGIRDTMNANYDSIPNLREDIDLNRVDIDSNRTLITTHIAEDEDIDSTNEIQEPYWSGDTLRYTKTDSFVVLIDTSIYEYDGTIPENRTVTFRNESDLHWDLDTNSAYDISSPDFGLHFRMTELARSNLLFAKSDTFNDRRYQSQILQHPNNLNLRSRTFQGIPHVKESYINVDTVGIQLRMQNSQEADFVDGKEYFMRSLDSSNYVVWDTVSIEDLGITPEDTMRWSGGVKTVNNVPPDGSGNVNVSADILPDTTTCIWFDGENDYWQASSSADLEFDLPIEIHFTYDDPDGIFVLSSKRSNNNAGWWYIGRTSAGGNFNIVGEGGTGGAGFTYDFVRRYNYVYRAYEDGGDLVQEINGVEQSRTSTYTLPSTTTNLFTLAEGYSSNNREFGGEICYYEQGVDTFYFDECVGTTATSTLGTSINKSGGGFDDSHFLCEENMVYLGSGGGLQILSRSGDSATLSPGGGTISIVDNDADSTNEIQHIRQSGDSIWLTGSTDTILVTGGSGGATITDFTEDKTGNNITLAITEDGNTWPVTFSIADADSSVVNELQEFASFTNPDANSAVARLSSRSTFGGIRLNGSSDISAQASFDGTDIAVALNAGALRSDINQNASELTAHEAADNDLSPTNELQDISINFDTIFLSGGGYIVLPPGSGGSDSLQQLVLQELADSVKISITGTNTISFAVDSSNINEIQNLMISGDSLLISKGTGVLLPSGVDSFYRDGDSIRLIAGSKNFAVYSSGTGTNIGASKVGNTVTLTSSTGTGDSFSVEDGDSDDTNEIQYASSFSNPSSTSAIARFLYNTSFGGIRANTNSGVTVAASSDGTDIAFDFDFSGISISSPWNGSYNKPYLLGSLPQASIGAIPGDSDARLYINNDQAFDPSIHIDQPVGDGADLLRVNNTLNSSSSYWRLEGFGSGPDKSVIMRMGDHAGISRIAMNGENGAIVIDGLVQIGTHLRLGSGVLEDETGSSGSTGQYLDGGSIVEWKDLPSYTMTQNGDNIDFKLNGALQSTIDVVDMVGGGSNLWTESGSNIYRNSGVTLGGTATTSSTTRLEDETWVRNGSRMRFYSSTNTERGYVYGGDTGLGVQSGTNITLISPTTRIWDGGILRFYDSSDNHKGSINATTGFNIVSTSGNQIQFNSGEDIFFNASNDVILAATDNAYVLGDVVEITGDRTRVNTPDIDFSIGTTASSTIVRRSSNYTFPSASGFAAGTIKFVKNTAGGNTTFTINGTNYTIGTGDSFIIVADGSSWLFF